MDRPRKLTRRDLLALLGTASVAGLAGCPSGPEEGPGPTPPEETATPTPTPTESPTPTETETARDDRPDIADRYEDYVDISEMNVDQEGGEPIDDALRRAVDDDTLVVFPSGDYLVQDFSFSGLDNVGFLAPDRARILPPDDIGEDYWLVFERMSNLHFEGFTLDNRSSGVAPAHLFNVTGGTNTVSGITVDGFREGDQHCLRPWPEGENTRLLLEDVVMTDGNNDGAAVFVPSNDLYRTNQPGGRLEFRNCYVEGFAQGVYASPHPGPLVFLGGRYANNGIAQVRIGGGTSGALVRNVEVRVDASQVDTDNKPNMRGIYVREGSGTRIEDCDIAFESLEGSYSDGAIVIHGYQGETSIHNTRIGINADDVAAVRAQEPANRFNGGAVLSMESLPDSFVVTAESVSITGNGSVSSPVVIKGRPDSFLENLCIHSEGTGWDGIHFWRSDGSVVQNSNINVSGEPVTTERTDVRVNGITRGISCDPPSLS